MINTILALHTNMQGSLVCCGLDPDWQRMPLELTSGKTPSENIVLDFIQGIVDVTASHVCAFKVQKAFFDIWPDGHSLLHTVISYIHKNYPGVPVILDCKIGDIDNTMIAYIDNIFGKLEADGVVVNPYMGESVLAPFFEHPKKAIVVLVKTSNPDGAIVQDLKLENGDALWEKILDYAVNRWNKAGNIIPVVSSTVKSDMLDIRRRIPDNVPILLAGVGAQGGSYSDLINLLNSRRSGVFVNSSRELLYPSCETGESWQDATEKAVKTLKRRLGKERGF